MNPPQTAYTCAVVIMILGKPTSLPHRHTFPSRQDLSQRPSVVCCFTPSSGSLYRSPENTHRNRTVNKTRPTRFPHSNYHAKTIFRENDFSSVLDLLYLELSLLFSPWLVVFFFQSISRTTTWLPLAEFHSVLDLLPGSLQQCQQRKSHRSLRRRHNR